MKADAVDFSLGHFLHVQNRSQFRIQGSKNIIDGKVLCFLKIPFVRPSGVRAVSVRTRRGGVRQTVRTLKMA